MYEDSDLDTPDLDQQLTQLFDECFNIRDIFNPNTRRSALQSYVKVWEDFIKKHDCLIQAKKVADKAFAQLKDRMQSGERVCQPSLYLFFYAFHYGHFDLAITLLASIALKEDPDFQYTPIKLLEKIFKKTPPDIKFSLNDISVIYALIKKINIQSASISANELVVSLPLYKIIKPSIELKRTVYESLLRNLRLLDAEFNSTKNFVADNVQAMLLIGAQIHSVPNKDNQLVCMHGEEKHQETIKKMVLLLVCVFLKFNALPLDIKIELLHRIMPVLRMMDAEVSRNIIESMKNAPDVTELNKEHYARQRRFVAIRGYTTFLERNGCPADLQKTAVQFNRRLIESRLQFFQDQQTIPLNLTPQLQRQLVDRIGAEVDTSPYQYHQITFKQRIVDEGIRSVRKQHDVEQKFLHAANAASVLHVKQR